jgi:hypothetical protein
MHAEITGTNLQVHRGTVSGIAACFGLDVSLIETQWEERFFVAGQAETGADPASYKMGTVSPSRE